MSRFAPLKGNPTGFTLISRSERAFTLIELLITISIIAILITIAIGAYASMTKNSRDAKRQSDLAVIQSALEQYKADQNFYPPVGTANGSLSLNTTGGTNTLINFANTKTYLRQVPKETLTGHTQYCYVASPASCTTACTTYTLYANMENSANANLTTAVDGCSSTGAPYNFVANAP